MRIIKKLIVALMITAMLVVSVVSVSAVSEYDKVVYITKEEFNDKMWDMYLSVSRIDEDTILDEKDAFTVSMGRYELTSFLEDYEPLNSDISVSDAYQEFSAHLKDVFEDIKIDVDENGNIYEEHKDGSKYDWTYNADKDMFVCTNKNGNIEKTYDRYHTDYELQHKEDTTVQEETQATTQEESYNYVEAKPYVDNSESNTQVKKDAAVAEVATSDSAEITSGMSTPQVIILSFVGVAIIGGIVALIFTYKKKIGK